MSEKKIQQEEAKATHTKADEPKAKEPVKDVAKETAKDTPTKPKSHRVKHQDYESAVLEAARAFATADRAHRSTGGDKEKNEASTYHDRLLWLVEGEKNGWKLDDCPHCLEGDDGEG
jgi:hypothetical protein